MRTAKARFGKVRRAPKEVNEELRWERGANEQKAYVCAMKINKLAKARFATRGIMGFFDWVMHGLGFESSEKKKGKHTKTIEPDEKYANFNLHEKVGPKPNKINENIGATNYNNFGIQSESNIIMVEPKSHSEIQQCVDYLKQGQSVAVNLEGLSSADMERILDFLSGAIYGLNGSIHRWHGDLFLLAPEGHKILKKE